MVLILSLCALPRIVLSAGLSMAWDDYASNEDGFIIEYRAQNEIQWVVLDTVARDVTQYTTEQLNPGTVELRVCAYNQTRRSDYSNVIEAAITSEGPKIPQNLTSANQTENTISLAWQSPVAGGVEVTGYRIVRNGVPLTDVMQTAYTDTGLKENTPYRYQIFSLDSGGNTSARAVEATFKTVAVYFPHDQAVSPYSTLLANVSVLGETQLNGVPTIQLLLTATESLAELPSPLIFVESDESTTQVTLAGSLPGDTFSGHLLLTDQVAPGVGVFRIKEGGLVSVLGNTGQLIGTGATLNVQLSGTAVAPGSSAADVQPPNSPTSLTSSSQSDHSIDLNWSAPQSASDGDAAQAYRIYRNGVLIKTTSETKHSDTGLGAGRAYVYAVYGIDDAGNISVQPVEATFSTTGSTEDAPSVLHARIIMGDPVAQEGGRFLPIQLYTSEPVIQLPSPLLFLESDQTQTQIPLSGSLPGSHFTGLLPITAELAGGSGIFSLANGKLVNPSGEKGNLIHTGKTIAIDKIPPPAPANFKIIP